MTVAAFYGPVIPRLAAHILLALLVAGCASRSPFLSSRLASDIQLDFTASDFWARTNKGVLEIVVRVEREDSDYRRDFGLELASATEICAAIAGSQVAFEQNWQTMDLTVWNEYGDMLRWRNTVGFIRVEMSREALRAAGDANVPSSGYPEYWVFLGASKAGPDAELLEWPPGASEPGSESRGPDSQNSRPAPKG